MNKYLKITLAFLSTFILTYVLYITVSTLFEIRRNQIMLMKQNDILLQVEIEIYKEIKTKRGNYI